MKNKVLFLCFGWFVIGFKRFETTKTDIDYWNSRFASNACACERSSSHSLRRQSCLIKKSFLQKYCSIFPLWYPVWKPPTQKYPLAKLYNSLLRNKTSVISILLFSAEGKTYIQGSIYPVEYNVRQRFLWFLFENKDLKLYPI